tara:strand:+ start:1629 stop:2582 length:954 start_codon:yes stop_codon:yes gene_type:complete
MGKPTYGGWVSFTSHLSLKYNYKLYKIAKKTEKLKSGAPRLRNFGYGVKYQNLSIEDAKNLPNIIITAIDKKYYEFLGEFSNNTKLVIHDPTEIKGKSCQPVLDVLERYDIITIRKSVKKFLVEKYDIKSKFKYHPFFEYTKTPILDKHKKGVVSISRVDFDKHTDITLKANKLLAAAHKIDIYGATNDRYVYFKLKTSGLDFEKYYKGTFKKSFEELDKILFEKRFVVDLSAIKNDGGGSQYTFLEAIYQGCILILNKQWLSASGNIFETGVNCLVVEDENDIVDIITTASKNPTHLEQISKNARKLLKPHINVKW